MNEELRNETMEETYEGTTVTDLVDDEVYECEVVDTENKGVPAGLILAVAAGAVGIGMAAKVAHTKLTKNKGQQKKTKLGKRFSAARVAFANPDVIDAEYEDVDVVEDSEK